MILRVFLPRTAALALLANVQCLPSTVVGAPQSESGIVTQNQPAANAWHPVTFSTAFPAVPIVVLGPATQNDSQPTTVRVRNVSTTGFEFQIDEWDYLDGVHAAETLSYLALEPGVHTIGGQRWEARRVSGVTRTTRTVALTGFSAAPVVLAQVESSANAQALAPRLINVTAASFGLYLQTQESITAAITGESVAYVAVSRGVGQMNGAAFISALTGVNMTDQARAILVGPHYRNPRVFALPQTAAGTDPVTVRQRPVTLSHGLEVPAGGHYQNHRGQQEKYLIGSFSANGHNDPAGYWYYVVANGDLYEFRPPYSNPGLDGDLVARLGASFYANPTLLTAGLTTPDPSYYLNYRGQQEKYLRATTSANGYVDATGYWYYLLANGALYEFAPPYSSSTLAGVPIAQLGPAFYNQPRLLTSGLAIPSGGYFTNYRGRQEKYLRANVSANGYSDPAGFWYYVLPGGALYEFTPPYSNSALNGVLLAQLGSAYYEDPTLVTKPNLAKGGFELSLQEEQSAETNTTHPAENVGYLLLSGSGDSDGDGMPDDWEIANGFNPNDPSDAALDADGDGVSNLDEYRNGTDPRVPNGGGGGGTVSVQTVTAEAFEKEGTSARIRVTRTSGTAAITVGFTLSGQATAGADYRTTNNTGGQLSGSVTIAANGTGADIIIEPFADTTHEYPEQATLTLSSSPSYTVNSAGAAASVTISDATDIPANDKLFVAFLGRQGTAQTTASGVGTMQLNGPNNRARVSLSFSGLTTGQTNAYIRYGVTSGVGPELRPTFPNGQFEDAIWDVVPVGIYTGQNIIDALFQIAGKFTYINIGTARYPSGEISGIWRRDSGSGTFVPPGPPPPIEPLAGDSLTRDVARFLTQATFGPTQAEINALVAEINNSYGGDRVAGFNAWIDQQFALEQTVLYHYVYTADQQEWSLRGSDPINYVALAKGEPSYFNRRRGWWTISAKAHDQLRQRAAFALSEIFVISEFDPTIQQYHYGAANYYDQLATFASGNYRDLLETISESPMMGYYLSHLKNQKAVVNGSGQVIISPDENYAREVMQLFSIGLVQRHPDGSLKIGSDGDPIATYTNTDITELARVFTGWSFSKTTGAQASGYPTVDNNNFNAGNGPRYFQPSWLNPMKNFPAQHDTAAKTVLGSTIPAGLSGDADLDAALDILFYHPNVGPFLSHLLIQRLVTSNPSNGYVYRVAQKFEDNGQGVRGDLKAVIRAILLDYEARSLDPTSNVGYGKQKEPIIRYLQFIRAVGGASQLPLSDLTSFGYLATQLNNFPSGVTRYRYSGTEGVLGQIPLRSPTVFNWFPPDYNPGGAIASAGLVAPELRLTNESSVIQAINYHYNLAQSDGGQGVDALFNQTPATLDDVRLDRTPLVALYDARVAAGATVPQAVTAVLNQIDALMLSGNFRAKYESAAAPNPRSIIIQEVSAISPAPTSLVRVKELLYLVVTSPEYIHQK